MFKFLIVSGLLIILLAFFTVDTEKIAFIPFGIIVIFIGIFWHPERKKMVDKKPHNWAGLFFTALIIGILGYFLYGEVFCGHHTVCSIYDGGADYHWHKCLDSGHNNAAMGDYNLSGQFCCEWNETTDEKYNCTWSST